MEKLQQIVGAKSDFNFTKIKKLTEYVDTLKLGDNTFVLERAEKALQKLITKEENAVKSVKNKQAKLQAKLNAEEEKNKSMSNIATTPTLKPAVIPIAVKTKAVKQKPAVKPSAVKPKAVAKSAVKPVVKSAVKTSAVKPKAVAKPAVKPVVKSAVKTSAVKPKAVVKPAVKPVVKASASLTTTKNKDKKKK